MLSERRLFLQTHVRLVHWPLLPKKVSFKDFLLTPRPLGCPNFSSFGQCLASALEHLRIRHLAPRLRRGCDPCRPPTTGCRLTVQAAADPALDRSQSALHCSAPAPPRSDAPVGALHGLS